MCWSITFIFQLIVNELFANILLYKDNVPQQLLQFYILVLFIDPIITKKIHDKISSYMIIAEKFYKAKEYVKFDNFASTSKNKITSEVFHKKMSDSWYSISNNMMNGYKIVIDILTNIYVTIRIFISQDITLLLVFLIVIQYLSYKFIVSKYHKATLDKDNKFRSVTKRIENFLNILLPSFENSQTDYNVCLSHDLQISDARSVFIDSFHKSHMIVTIINVFCLAVLILGGSNITIILSVFGKFSSAVQSLNGFLDWYLKLNSNFVTYLELMDGHESNPLPSQHNIPEKIVLVSVNIPMRKKVLTFVDGLKSLTIRRGNKILIQGPSGHGKSTFIDSLIGKKDGIALDILTPRHFYTKFVELYQNIKEHLNTNNVTIRELFNGELNDQRILESCVSANSMDWINELELDENIKNNNSNENIENNNNINLKNDDEVIIKVHSNKLDTIIGPISGGQKMRLAIAMQLYKFKKRIDNGESVILILDEPEQGSDPKIAYKIIRDNIIKNFPNETIILVSHLELIRKEVNWDIILEVENGFIKKV